MDRFETRKERWATIERMNREGASIEEIAKATGYKEQTVKTVMSTVCPKKNDEGEKLIYAEKEKPVIETIIIGGKRYLDITDLFLTTDWEGVEVGV